MKNVILILLLALAGQTIAQQTIRGTITDGDTKAPLFGVTVVAQKGDSTFSASSDVSGKFRIENVPLGRVNLKFYGMGYEEKVMPNIVVGAAKEVVLSINLTESLEQLETVEIKKEKKGAEVENEMATSSARTFSVEETKRYAGSFNDPARMVANYAGVVTNAEGNNDIVVRGNSSRGILWRLEGVEIPNPNHFGGEGQTGGPINALNSSMLANSEFYSGAFAPQYGNAFSGVFDMKLRTGNNEKRETSIGIGALGIDVTTEGPTGGGGSYLVNYRYSSLALLDGAGLVDYSGVPKYQDASFKVNLPTKKAGKFSLFGLGGLSSIHQKAFDEEDEDKLVADNVFKAHMGVVGLNHTYLINPKAYLKSGISVSGNGNETDYELLGSNGGFFQYYNDLMQKQVYRAQSTLNYKLNKNHKFQVGGIYSHYTFDMNAKVYDFGTKKMETRLSDKGDAGTAQGFVSWKYKVNPKLTLVSGAHFLHFMLNQQNSFEPRVGMKYKVTPKQTLTAGFGIHSKMESFTTYFSKDTLGNLINRDLDFSRAMHYVLGYSNTLTKNLQFKTEVYFQSLDKIPVENLSNSMYSLINDNGGGTTSRTYVNEGHGMNYGIELTLERFYANRFFYLITGSLYESKYRTKDGVWRDTRYNGNYAANAMFGKEWQIGKKEKNRVIGTSIKLVYLGGTRYTGVDVAASEALGETVWEDELFGKQSDDIFKLDVAVYYRRDKKRTTHEFKIDIQNATNNQAKTSEWFDVNNKKLMNGTQLPMLPVVGYTLSF